MHTLFITIIKISCTLGLFILIWILCYNLTEKLKQKRFYQKKYDHIINGLENFVTFVSYDDYNPIQYAYNVYDNKKQFLDDINEPYIEELLPLNPNKKINSPWKYSHIIFVKSDRWNYLQQQYMNKKVSTLFKNVSFNYNSFDNCYSVKENEIHYKFANGNSGYIKPVEIENTFESSMMHIIYDTYYRVYDSNNQIIENSLDYKTLEDAIRFVNNNMR